MIAAAFPTLVNALDNYLTLVYFWAHRSEHMSSRETDLSHLSCSGVMMAAKRAGHPKFSKVWERRNHQWRRELTLRALLSSATVKVLTDSGVARSRLDQLWISAKENKGVCGGFGIGVRCLLPDARKGPNPFPPH